MPKSSIQKERAESLFKRRVEQQVEGGKALTDYQLKEQATRVLTAKLRAERLARESTSPEAKGEIEQIVTHVTPAIPAGLHTRQKE